jgi:hypothetical protein
MTLEPLSLLMSVRSVLIVICFFFQTDADSEKSILERLADDGWLRRSRDFPFLLNFCERQGSDSWLSCLWILPVYASPNATRPDGTDSRTTTSPHQQQLDCRSQEKTGCFVIDFLQVEKQARTYTSWVFVSSGYWESLTFVCRLVSSPSRKREWCWWCHDRWWWVEGTSFPYRWLWYLSVIF